MDFQWAIVLAGFTVGFVVGLTGVGGGSLMTPILLYFGVQPTTAVGTDLLYAAVTKSGGIVAHHRQDNINWHIAGLLTLGSVPAALLTLWLLHFNDMDSEAVNRFIRIALGSTIVSTAIAILLKDWLLEWSHRRDAIFTRMTDQQRRRATIAVGAVMGSLVTITSIGAGVLGTVSLFLIYTSLPVPRLVGTEIAHAVPLTLVAGLGHAGLGNVDWGLLLNLLMGSLPGIYLGSHLPSAIPEKVLRPVLSGMLILVGARLLLT